MKAAFFIIFAVIAAAFCLWAADAAHAGGGERAFVRGEAVVLLRVPEEIRASKERRELFAAYCRGVAADACSEVVYVSPVYETSECVTATFRSKLETAELIARLRKDARVAGASPNYIMKLSRPVAVKN